MILLNLDSHTFSYSPELEHKFFSVSKHPSFLSQLNAFRSMRTWTPEECCSEAHGGPQLVNNYRPPLPLGNRVLRECGAMWDDHVGKAYYYILYLLFNYIIGRHRDIHARPTASATNHRHHQHHRKLMYTERFVLNNFLIFFFFKRFLI